MCWLCVIGCFFFFFFKQKTAYEMRISDWSSDVCSSDLNFSDRTMAEFFEDEFGVDIYQEKYGFDGTSKAKPLRAFIETEDEYTVAKVARTLWQHRENLSRYQNKASEAEALKAARKSAV